MRKILSVVLALAIMMTVVSSMAFATTPGYLGNVTVTLGERAASAERISDNGIFVETRETPAKALNGFKLTINTTELAEYTDWRYVKVSANFKALKTTISNIALFNLNNGSSLSNFRPATTTTNKSRSDWGTGVHNIFIIYDKVENSYYLGYGDMITRVSLNNTVSQYTTYNLQPAQSDVVATGTQIYQVTDVTGEVYGSEATLENMGLKVYSAKYDPAKSQYTVCESLIKSASGSTNGLDITGAVTDVTTYIAGYKDGKLAFVKDINLTAMYATARTATITGVEEADELKSFIWSSDGKFTPYMQATPVNIERN